MAAARTAMLRVEDLSEVEALVDQAPRAARSWGRKAVVALALAGAGACAAARLWPSGPTVPAKPAKRKHLFTGETLQAYERLERMLSDAGTIQEPRAPEGLNATALMYTQCSVDVFQAGLYLGQAVVFLEKVKDYEGYTCPDTTERGCTVMVASIITSFFWVMSYLSSAASMCVATINYPASCSSDITSVLADMGEIAAMSTAAADDCYFKKKKPDWASVLRVWNTTRHSNYYEHMHVPENSSSWASPWTAPAPSVLLPSPPLPPVSSFGRRLSVPPSKMHSVLDPMKALVEKHNAFVENREAEALAHHMENLDLTLCALDVGQVVSYIIRAVKQIMQSTLDTCDDPQVCTIDLFSIISTFSWLAQFWAYAFADCARDGNQRAYCAGDISDIIAGTTNLVCSAMLITPDCSTAEKAANEKAALEKAAFDATHAVYETRRLRVSPERP